MSEFCQELMKKYEIRFAALEIAKVVLRQYVTGSYVLSPAALALKRIEELEKQL